MAVERAHVPTVLVVDDDASVRSLLSYVVRHHLADYEIVVAADGAEALDYLTERAIELVITDHEMPRLSGLELVQIVKARTPELPVILISGDLLHDIEQQAQDCGVDFFLPKPFLVAQLTLILDAVCGR